MYRFLIVSLLMNVCSRAQAGGGPSRLREAVYWDQIQMRASRSPATWQAINHQIANSPTVPAERGLRSEGAPKGAAIGQAAVNSRVNREVWGKRVSEGFTPEPSAGQKQLELMDYKFWSQLPSILNAAAAWAPSGDSAARTPKKRAPHPRPSPAVTVGATQRAKAKPEREYRGRATDFDRPPIANREWAGAYTDKLIR